MNRFYLVAAIGFLLGCGTPQERTGTGLKTALSLGETWRLDNGLQVILRKDTSLPYVTVAVAYKVGSVNETKGITGISHFLEHMMFKGTANFPSKRLEMISYDGGGENNAFTSNDVTVYYFKVTKDKLDEVLHMERDRMTSLEFKEEHFAQQKSEREVVINEKMRGLDDPWGLIYERVEEKMFTTFPYQHPVIGSIEDLKSISREQMIDYYKKHYAPNNAVLVVWGDIPDDTLQKVTNLFGNVEKRDVPPPPEKNEPEQTEQKRVELETDKGKTRLLFGFKFALSDSQKLLRPDRPAKSVGNIDQVAPVVISLLAGGRNSRLVKRLVEIEKLVPEGEVQIDYWPRKYYGVFFINVTPYDGVDTAKVEEVVFDELGKLSNVRDVELQKAKNMAASRFVFDKESGKWLAVSLAMYNAMDLPDYLAGYLDKLNSITTRDVASFASNYLKKAKSTLGISKGKVKDESGGKSMHGGEPGKRFFGKSFCREDRACLPYMQGNQVEFTDLYQVTLSNGLTVIVKQKLDVPVISIKTYTNSGFIFESPDKAGISRIVGQMLDEGTHDRITAKNYEQIAAELEEIGAEMETSPTAIRARCLANHFRKTLATVRDCLVYPSFPNDRFEKVKKETLDEIEAMKDYPRNMIKDMFYANVYKGTPLARPEIGTKEIVEKLTVQDAIEHHKKFFRPDNTIIAISGAVDPLRAIVEVRRLFSEWANDDVQLDLPVPKPNRQPSQVSLELNRETDKQINVYMGHIGIDRNDPDYYALRVAETILGAAPAMVDRLSLELREGSVSCYEVWGTITRGADYYPSAFTVYFGFFDVKRRDEAMKTAMGVLKKFVSEGPTDEEVNSTKNHLAKRFFSTWEVTSDLCDYLILLKRFNLPVDYHKSYVKGIQSLTKEQVHQAIKKHLDPTKMVIVTGGPLKK